jgi:hypothetical protein
MTTLDEAKLQVKAMATFGRFNGFAAELGAHYGAKASLFDARPRSCQQHRLGRRPRA